MPDDQMISPKQSTLDALLGTMEDELYKRLYARIKRDLRMELLSHASGHVYINEARVLLSLPDEAADRR